MRTVKNQPSIEISIKIRLESSTYNRIFFAAKMATIQMRSKPAAVLCTLRGLDMQFVEPAHCRVLSDRDLDSWNELSDPSETR